jgi:flagellar FliL protein
MADDELELDTQSRAPGSGFKMIILMVILALLVSASVIAGLYFTGNLNIGGEASSKAADESPAAAESETPTEAAEHKPAIYIDMKPAFIVNFPDDAVAEYLQIEMQAQAHDEQVEAVMRRHMPVIRNDILLLLSSQKYSDLKTREGKQHLQKAVLDKVRKIVREGMVSELQTEEAQKVDTASLPNVDNIFFTSFIMQ